MAGRDLSPREQQLFRDFLAALTAANIPWLLLRNYDGFPARVGNDVDLFLPRLTRHDGLAIFRRVLQSAGGILFQVNERDYFIDLRFGFSAEASSALHLDLYHGSFTWHGLPYLTEQRLLADAASHGGHRIPRPAHEALNLLFGSILWGGFFKSRYQPRIAELLSAAAEREEFDRCVRDAFGEAGVPPFDPCSPVFPPKTLVLNYAWKLRRALKLESLRRAPLATPARIARHWAVEFKTVLSPLGLFIAVLGPDGSGKSSVIEQVRDRLGRLFVDTHLHHWRPGVLPDLGVVLQQREKRTGPVENPHGQSPHAAPVGLLRLMYYLLDYWLGWFPRILKPIAMTKLVFFDRYAPDMWCDPRRYRFQMPRALIRAVAALAPTPDFTFVLLADEATLAQRKGELSSSAARAALDNYRQLADSGRHCFAINAGRSLNDVVAEIESIVINHMRTRVGLE